MRLVAILIATVLAPALPLHSAAPDQTRPRAAPPLDGRPFVVRLPDGADACTIDTFQSGSFGGYSGGPESARVTQRTLSIPTSKDTRTLKAAIWCRGSGVALVDVPALESSSFETTVTPPRLKPRRVNARMHPDDVATAAGREMKVSFEAGWICAFFNVLDCVVPRFPMATARIGKDGSVSFDVPDILGDPALKKFGFFGGFAMDVEEPAPAFNYYRLEPPGGRTLTPAAEYREPIVLRIRK
jgi:hypothetical protein